MPIPDQRDPEITRDLLTRWLSQHLPGVRIPLLKTPTNTGFSSETLMFDAVWGDREERREALVARVAPIHFQIFPEPRFAEQYRVMRLLDERTDIPVPPIRWYEPANEPLGAPFIVMGRIDGDVPTDMPPYHQDGWVTTIPPAERTAMWWSTLEIMARLHALDPAGFAFLDQPTYGRTGIGQRLGYYEHYLKWAYPGPQPTAVQALEWLRTHRPPGPPSQQDPEPGSESEPISVLWGDARIGNVIFQAGGPQAVLDWETATLGAPEEDLAWFCYLDRHHSEGVGVPRLPGFPTREETYERYAELLGRPLRHMFYYEVLSAFKFAVIMARIGQAFIDFELIPADSDFPYNNTATQLLATILDLPAPGSLPIDPFGGRR
jgi:aminoglycoside phosphotransferase (APT) family kinase protein